MVVAAVGALALALGVSWFVTRRLTAPVVRVAATARALAAGDRTARARIDAPGELGDLARAFDTMADNVGHAEQARHRLAADVAHELRTPLASLRAGLEELRDGYTEPAADRLAPCTTRPCGWAASSTTSGNSQKPSRPGCPCTGPKWI